MGEKGIIISGKFSEILARQKSDEEIELGELLIAENSTSKILLQAYDLVYGSQLSSSNLELVSGMKLEEDSDLFFMDENLRNYTLAVLKNLITINKDSAKSSKSLPSFFSTVREVEKTDLNFLTKPRNPLYVGNLRSGSKTLNVDIFLPGKKVLSHHILMAATTGRGKSLDGNEEVMIMKNNSYHIKPIKDIVSNSSIYEGSKAISMNPKNFTVEFKEITDFIKHDAPKHMYRVLSESGREVTVTGDHNLHVLRNGKISLLKTEEVSQKDYLPFPLKIEQISNQTELNIFELLKDSERIYVLYSEKIKGKLKSKRECLDILSRYYNKPLAKYNDFIVKKNKIQISLLTKLLQSKLSYNLLKDTIVTDLFSTVTLKAIFPLSKEFLELLGYYIAEGYSQNENSFRISASNEKIQDNLKKIFKSLGLKSFWFKKQNKNVDVGVSSTLFTSIQRTIGVGKISGNKRLPNFFMNLSNQQLKQLLQTYFEGDGGIDREIHKINKKFKISSTTKSKKLSSDISLALQRFGIFCRVKKTWKRATNTSHKGSIYYKNTISGVEEIKKFLKEIGFKFQEKNEILKGRLNYEGNTNVDLIPISHTEFKAKRIELNLSQKEFSKRINYSQQIISLIEQGKRRPSRKLMKKILLKCDNFKSFSKLMNFRWDKVKEIKRVNYDKKHVYDLTVKDNHTFFTGHGGLFVHNSNLASVMLWSLMDKDYAGILVLDPHDEYFGRTNLGLKDHPNQENLIYYSLNPPAGQRSLKINIKQIKPGHFNGVMDWSPAQKEALTAYYRRFKENWIEAIILEKETTGKFMEGTLAVVKRRILSLLNIEFFDNSIHCKGVFDLQSGQTTISDISSDLEKGKIVVVDTSSFSGSVEILIGSLITTEVFSRYKRYKTQGLLSQKAVISILLEEAPRVLGKEVLEKGPNIFSTIAREGRKFQIGLTAITQLPSLIPRQILANMNTKIILGIEMAPERQAIIDSASQDLSSDSRAIAALDKGEAIITSNFTRFAIPVKIPLFSEFTKDKIKEKISDLGFDGVDLS